MKLKIDDTLVIATHNHSKLEEIKVLLEPYQLNIKSSESLDVAEPDETETTFAGNALLKARYTANKTGYVSLADDSGLSVPALDGMPGIYSARWGGPERDFQMACEKVNHRLGDKPRKAYFICVLAVVWPDGSAKIFKGQTQGQLVWPTRGEKKFGYDSMFVPNGDTRTYGEMTIAEKSLTSHRTKAFALFKRSLLPMIL